ncbi:MULTISPECIES: hypothetical protein [unclassified Arcicella]|uniref:hypothetical protein n=1 Tax=unclassified Arcicella TaxID=2644986 RepID=UPI002865F08F|nr:MULTISPECIES: hypothetical protein [unclassified Arcicella]MDR6560789.1 hypothetical protein [Arcicella sp. BE51]MDR6810673.1 hypothetical protein [Arcicella sp. BE140]MDR6822023.1 hypothetical protein [Arcicella sp. BE139]
MDNYFLMMLRAIREQEEVILYNDILQVSEPEQHQAIAYLNQVYQQESLEYPYQSPPFDSSAGLWAAKTVYVASQLLLYRKNTQSDLLSLLPEFALPKTSAGVLSVDLTLRFLPDIITQLDILNPEDELIPILEKHLYTWHYSGVSYPLSVENLDFSIETSDPCLRQLYANRIIEYRRKPLEETTAFADIVGASLGNYRDFFWKNY